MSGNLTHVLFENASGYALFEVTMQEEIVSCGGSVLFGLWLIPGVGGQEQGGAGGRSGLEQVFEDGKVEEFFAVYECGRGAAECE